MVVRPTNQATEKGLLYRAWVERNREYVLKASGGRLGYVHMINMSAAALDQLHIDLDADNHKLDGVIVDIRNNNGGFVNAYAIDVFTRQPYLRMSTRDLPEAPARTVLGQRALESATVLVTNQHSLSDAEDFTEGYRTLKLGPVVGEPTAGWIIYTWDARLVDGSTLRLPRMRVKAADGSDMEMHPRAGGRRRRAAARRVARRQGLATGRGGEGVAEKTGASGIENRQSGNGQSGNGRKIDNGKCKWLMGNGNRLMGEWLMGNGQGVSHGPISITRERCFCHCPISHSPIANGGDQRARGITTSVRLRTVAPGRFTRTRMKCTRPSRSSSVGSTPSR